MAIIAYCNGELVTHEVPVYRIRDNVEPTLYGAPIIYFAVTANSQANTQAIVEWIKSLDGKLETLALKMQLTRLFDCTCTIAIVCMSSNTPMMAAFTFRAGILMAGRLMQLTDSTLVMRKTGCSPAEWNIRAPLTLVVSLLLSLKKPRGELHVTTPYVTHLVPLSEATRFLLDQTANISSQPFYRTMHR
jgi:hypothetical protein